MKKSVWLLSALSVLVCLTGCQDKGVKIGVSAPISGDIAALGQSTKNAVLLAQEEINAKGGITIGGTKQKVTFIIEDDENKPEAAATVFQKLINQDKVAAIIGSQSSKCSNAGAPIAEAAGIPQISPWSTNPNVTKDKRFVFRACFIDPFQGKAVAGFARGKMKAGTAAVLYDVASDYNKGIAEVFRNEFTKAGGKIVGFETYNTNDKDFSAQLSKIKGAAPDVLFLPNYFNDVPLQVQQARKLGMTCKFIGSDGWDNQELIKMGGKDMEGTYFSNHYSPDVDRPASKKFIASYAKKYNTQVDAAAALTYDSVYLLVNAMEKAGKLDSKAIRDALAGTKNFDGVTGVITYNGSGDPIKGAVMIRVENGKFVFDSAVN
ncbi:ABC transporter substrate-binding protein [Geobacter sp. FeAm09]|uniref:ABC transporter substrate-binding protein n=1 Tax=Geobacter sp. FeAm09 TaxID=2597769 RepID=UPI0011F07E3F|nr:ABC transporter substrate-binding protein [Geobacter sp. FeAm09]QEM67670.1 ABC transporter substrate-binding protein [Geobacter sp. FeAm09]